MILSPRERALILAGLRSLQLDEASEEEEHTAVGMIVTGNGKWPPVENPEIDTLYDKLFVELPASKDEIVMGINKELLGAVKSAANWFGELGNDDGAQGLLDQLRAAVSKARELVEA